MNETKPNIFLNKISNNLVKTSNNILKMKHLIVTLRLSQKGLQDIVDLDCSNSQVIEIAEEKINACINGCLNLSTIINSQSNEDSIIEQYKNNILNPLDGAMAICVVIKNSLDSNLSWYKGKEKIENNAKCIYLIESTSQTADMIWDILNEQISDSLYDDFNEMKRCFNKELEVETN